MDRRALHKQFLQQFPQEHLGNMTLDEYTNLDKDNSFCYWLESKTYELGSIWGGSSYKFGIFKYEKSPKLDNSKYSHDENYSWSSRLGETSKEAFENVKEAIVKIATHAQQAEWEEIEKINALWPITTWKIAFLYSNERLLPFYDKEGWLVPIAVHLGLSNAKQYSRIELQNYILKQKGDKDLYDFCDELVSIIEKGKFKKKVWLFAPGENAHMWEECKESQTMRLGWNPIGDLSEYQTREELTKALQIAYKKEDSSFRNDSLALWQFIHDVQIGDIVYAKKGLSKIIGRGIVEGDYYYDDSLSTYRHIRRVKWSHYGDWDYSWHNLPLKTLTDISKYPEFVKRLDYMIVEGKVEETKSNSYNDMYKAYINLLLNNHNLIFNGAPGTGKTYLAKQVAAQIIYEGNVPESFEEDANFIEQCGFVQFHPSYDYTDFVEGLRPKNDNGNIGFERKDGTFKDFCAKALQNLLDSKKTVQTLQNELSVRDLLEGFINESMENETMFETSGTKNAFYIIDNKEKSIIVRIPANEKTSEVSLPKSDLTTLLENKVDIKGGGDIQTYFGRKYRTQPDSYVYVLYNELVKKAVPLTKTKSVAPVSEKNFVFIIDEINRGEISKIFGELFFSVDPGYRGVKGKVQTQYQNLITEDDPFKDGFYIPENVYIIGTMNDIDRSVECMDFAMRRRFTFKEITAEESARNMELGTDATERMMSLNNAISEIDGFNSSFHIGAAYFKGVDDFDALWELKLAGLLKEYLRGMPDAEESLEALKKAYYLSNE